MLMYFVDVCVSFVVGVFVFCNDTATTEIYTYLHTLSLHDARPISRFRRSPRNVGLGHPLFEEARYHLDRTGAAVGLPPRSGFVQQGARLRRTAWSLGRGK